MLAVMVPEVELGEDARVVFGNPVSRVFLEHILPGRDDMQLEAVTPLPENIRGAFYHRYSIQEVSRLEKKGHFLVCLLPRPTPCIMKIVTREILRGQAGPVGSVVERAELTHELTQHFIDVNCYYRHL